MNTAVNSANTLPFVSIGMPVYNEARFLEPALHSLLQQDYENFQVCVSDNASTDDTLAIATRVADADSRVKVFPNDRNIGATANFQRVVELAEGKYFMWAAGHDEWAPDLLSRSVAALEENPAASLANAGSFWIDETGRRCSGEIVAIDTRGLTGKRRFFKVFWGSMHPVLGLVRLEHLRATRGMQSFAGADLVLLSELVLMGDFVNVPGSWWHRRDVRAPESHRQRMRRYTSTEYGQASGLLDRWFPLLRLPFALLGSVWRARISVTDKLFILSGLLPSLPVRYFVGRRARSKP